MKIDIDILLATYNGSHYLDKQIQSIIDQTYPFWRIIARDDGSTDETIEILRKWKNILHERLIILDEDCPKNLGVIANFEKLLKYSTSKYIAFCDQDDFWYKDKLEIFINNFILLEKKYGLNLPYLVFSDLEVTDSKLEPIAGSFWKLQKINPYIVNDPRKLALSNCVTGCAMMINQNAAKIAVPMLNAMMHDWWIALCVSKNNGKFGIIKEKTISYRQHSYNVVGAKKQGFLIWLKKIIYLLIKKDDFNKCFYQAKALNIYNNKYYFFFVKSFSIIRRLFNYV